MGFLKKGKSRKQKGQKKGKHPKTRQPIRLETLEPRILLSADLVYATSGGSHDLTLQMQNVNGVETVQLVDMNATDPTLAILASQALSDTSGVVITGSGEDDRLTVDFTNPFGDLDIFFNDFFQADNDVLRAVGLDETTWNVTGKNGGNVENVSFDGVENLAGDAGNQDTFVFGQNGSMTGGIDGGAGGFDTLVIEGSYDTAAFSADGPDSGAVTLDGRTLVYAGLEPITLASAADITVTGRASNDHMEVTYSFADHMVTVSSPGTMEAVTFAAPSDSLTIDGLGGDDSVTFGTFLDLGMAPGGANLTVNAEVINVDAVLWAHDITFNAVASDDGSVAPLHDIDLDLDFDAVVLGSATARINVTDGALVGSIVTLIAESTVNLDTDGFGLGSLQAAVAYATSDARINITGSSSIGAEFSFTMRATSTVTATAILNADSTNTNSQMDAAIAVTVAESSAVAHISDDSYLNVNGDVVIEAENIVTTAAIADGSAGDESTAGAALALSIVKGETRAYVDGDVTGDSSTHPRSLTIAADAITTTTAKAISTPGGTQENSGGNKTQDKLDQYEVGTGEGDLGIAAAVAITDVTRPVESFFSTTGDWGYLEEAIDISSSSTGRVSAIADGTTTDSGSVGIGAAAAVNLADLDTTAHVGSSGAVYLFEDTVTVSSTMGGRRWTFDPSEDGDDESGHETIDLGVYHGFKTGDQVRYSAGGGDPIGGLEDDETYYIIVDAAAPHMIKLATTEENAKSGHAIELDASTATGDAHSLTEKAYTVYADAVSGAGSEDVGIAGALALNIATINTEAYVEATSTLDLGGANLALNASSKTQITAKANPKENATGETVGIGASVAINIVDSFVKAELRDGSLITDLTDLTLDAEGNQKVSTQAKGGAAGGVAITPVVAVSLVNSDVYSRVGVAGDGDDADVTPDTLVIAGLLDVSAVLSDTVATKATGAAEGTDAAIGASLALSMVGDMALADTARSLTAGGAVTFSASDSGGSRSEAKSSAKGGKKKTERQNASSTPGSKEPENVDEEGQTQRTGVDTQATSRGARTSSSRGDTPSSSSSDGPVTVAAAIAINLTDATAKAFIPDGLNIIAGGTLTINSANDASASALADGSATKGDIGVGAAVSVNRADVINQAYIGDSYVVAEGVVMAAAENPQEFTFNSADDVNDTSQNFTFDPGLAVNDQTGFENITLGEGHGLVTGDMVIYKKGAETDKVIGGLSDGTVYYVIANSGPAIRLASSRENARAGNAIDLDLKTGTDDATTGTAHKLVKFNEIIDLGEPHGLRTGDLVVYRKGAGDAVGGLIDGEVYYAIVDDNEPNRLRLAKSTADASANLAVDLTKVTGTGFSHTLVRMSIFMAEATSGAGGKDVGVAGSLALNIIDKEASAVIRTGAIVDTDSTDSGIDGGAISLHADNSTIDVATANATLSGKGDVGVGLSVALNIVDTVTRVEIEDSAFFLHLGDIDLRGVTSPLIRTKAEAGASGADVSVGGAVAITLADATTTARVGTGAATNLDGILTLEAREENGTVFTTADGAVSGKDVGVGAAVALAITSDEVLATTERALIVDGGARSTMLALNEVRVETNAKASAKGVKEESSGGSSTANQQKDEQRNFAKNTATSSGSSAGRGEDTGDTSDASTSDGSVGVAAGIAINISDVTAEAALKANYTGNGEIEVHSAANADVIAKADGSAVDPKNADVGVGVAVAINLADVKNQAYIDSDLTVNARGVRLVADTANREGEADPQTHTLKAEAVSGAGAADVGVAGSVAVNIVDVVTRAEVRENATVGVGGSVFIAHAMSETDSTTTAKPMSGGAEGDVGVGASVAVAVIDNTTIAEVQDGAHLQGYLGGKPTGVTVAADGTYKVTTGAENGAKGDDVAVGASVAVAVIDNETRARIGTDSGATVEYLGDVDIISTHKSTTLTKADAEAAGDVGVGVSVGVTVVDEIATANLARSFGIEGDLNGHVTVKADSVISSTIESKASAGGAEKEGDKSGTGTGRTADEEAGAQVNSNPNASREGSETLPSANSQTTSASSTSSSESSTSSSGVGVAAAVSVNVITVHNTAFVSNGADIFADGSVNVVAEAEVDATAKATGYAVSLEEESDNVAAAVGFNYVHAENVAYVDSGSSIRGFDVNIEAVTPDDATNDFIVWGASGAGGQGDLAVAGSVGINIIKFRTEASAQEGTTLVATDDLAVTAESDLRLQTLAVGAAFSLGDDAAVGAAVAVSVVDGINADGNDDTDDPMTCAYIAGNADASGDLSVTAETDFGPVLFAYEILGYDIAFDISSMAIAGGASTGDAGVGAAVIVNVFDLDTRAYIAPGSRINTSIEIPGAGTSVTVSAANSTDIDNFAGSLGVATGSAGVGIGLDVTVIHKDTRAYIGSEARVVSEGDIAVNATSSEDILSIAANAGVAEDAGIAASLSVQVLDTKTLAYVDDMPDGGSIAYISADGNVTVTATGTFKATLIAGSLGAASEAGIGASSTAIDHDDTVKAFVGNGATVVTKGNVGLSVIATSSEEIISIAAAGGFAGTVSVAGSAVVTLLDETTLAYVDTGAHIEATTTGSNNPSVILTATDNTTIVSVAGSLSAAGTAAVGLGADVAEINKRTETFIGSDVWATVEKDIIMTATSSEDITSVAAGLGAAGTVAVTLDASVHVLDITTRSYIGDDPDEATPSAGAGHVHAVGNIIMSADGATEVDKVVGVLAVAGTAGVGAAGAVTIIDKDTEAFVGEGAKVTADGAQGTTTVKTGAFTPGVGSTTKFDPNNASGEGVQTSGITSTPTSTSTLKTQGEIDTPDLATMDPNQNGGDDLNDSSFNAQRTVSAGTRSGFRGLSITATNKDDIEAFTVSLAGGTAGVAISAGVNVITTATQAYIGEDALINENTTAANAGQSVNIAAGNDFYHLAVAGTLAAGVVGVSPAVGVTVLSNSTRGFIGTGATINAKNDIYIEAHAREDIMLIGFGIAAGMVGIGGAVDVLTIDNTTVASIGDATVFAGGDILLFATDDTDVDIVSGALAAGFVGVGASVGVMVIDKDTQAFIDDGATVDALGGGSSGFASVLNGTMVGDGNDFGTSPLAVSGLVLQAQSSEDIFHLAVAAGAGFVGVSGGVAVTVIDSDTASYIGANAQINQADTDGDGIRNEGANAAQSVYVNASNKVKVTSFAGSLAAGFVGVGGAVDVGTVKNDTTAKVLGGAYVTAAKDVEVNALGIKDIDGYTVSGAGGVVGLTASVSVWSVGTPIERNYSDNDGNSANAVQGDNGAADQDAANQASASQTQTSSMLGGFDDGNTSDGKKSSDESVGRVTGLGSSRLTEANKGSSALMASVNDAGPTVGTVAGIETGAVITAGEDIEVTAYDDVEVNETVGSVAAGLVGVGASVAIVNVGANVTAYASGTLTAGNAIIINAVLDDDVDIRTYGGAAGFVGLGASVVVVNDKSTVASYIANGSDIIAANNLAVFASNDQYVYGRAGQVAAGAVGAGAAFVKIDIDNDAATDTRASIGSNVDVGWTGESVGAVNVMANAYTEAKAETFALSAGIGAFSGNFAVVDITPEVEASIGSGSRMIVDSTIDVSATATPKASGKKSKVAG